MITIHTIYERLIMDANPDIQLTAEEVDVLLGYLRKSLFYNPLIDLDAENYNC